MFKNKIFKNASWIISCKIMQSILNLIVGMISARYLGPSNYGLINYATSLVAFLVPFMQLGFQSTLVQELTADEKNEGKILGTAVILNFISGIICIFALLIFVFFANHGEKVTMIVCILSSLSLVLQVTEMLRYWFQVKLLSKYPSMAALFAYVIVFLYKLYLLISGQSIYWFALIGGIDHLLIGGMLIFAYFKMGGKRPSFSISYAKRMLSKSKFYILSGALIAVFQNTDRLMIKSMLDEAAVGYYSAAVTCAGIFGFVYAAIIDSASPVILKAKEENQAKFEKSVSSLYAVIFWLSLTQCVGTTILSSPIIKILYGAAYAPAIGALRVSVWYITFSYMGVIRNVWILAEKKYKYLWMIDTFGALANITLNFMLIPSLGINGAALASFLTQFFMNFILGFILEPIRYNNKIMLKGLNPNLIIELIKTVFQEKKEISE